MAHNENALTLSVVLPVFNGGDSLRRCLEALCAANSGSEAMEIIVVDDGSSDGSADIARTLGARVVPSGGHALGPAAARNVGAREAKGDLLLFVDADVLVAADALGRVLDSFEDEDLGAVFGSYDDTPLEENDASLYMNLRHHHGHRVPSENAATFWTGLGAVRRKAFLSIGGFDLDNFPYPSVEDIDLGQRLRASGVRIRRDPNLLGTHLKRWSWRTVIHTDIFRRARPWAEMMIAHPGRFTDLNVARSEQWKALLAGSWLLLIALSAWGLLPLWMIAAGFALVLLVNHSLTLVFLRAKGPRFALVGMLFHQLYFLYAAATYTGCRVHRLMSGPSRTGSA